MNETQFIEMCRSMLPSYDKDSIDMVKRDLGYRFQKGWSVQDAVKFLSVTEEFNPNIDETQALDAMNKLTKKYERNS